MFAWLVQAHESRTNCEWFWLFLNFLKQGLNTWPRSGTWDPQLSPSSSSLWWASMPRAVGPWVQFAFWSPCGPGGWQWSPRGSCVSTNDPRVTGREKRLSSAKDIFFISNFISNLKLHHKICQMCQNQNEQQIVAEIQKGHTLLAEALFSLLEQEWNVLLPAPSFLGQTSTEHTGTLIPTPGEKQNPKTASLRQCEKTRTTPPKQGFKSKMTWGSPSLSQPHTTQSHTEGTCTPTYLGCKTHP